MQDVEFTVEDGKLWMLQCRNGKRTVFMKTAGVAQVADILAGGAKVQLVAFLDSIRPGGIEGHLAPHQRTGTGPADAAGGGSAGEGAKLDCKVH